MKKPFLFLLLCFISFATFSQKTYIWCGTLIDGISNEPKKEMTIVIEKNKIVAVEKGYSKAGTADKTIDLKTKTVTPGWMDMHVHMEEEITPNRYLERFTMNPPDVAFRSIPIAEKTLMAGFTTVRDLGGSGVNISLRNAINAGTVRGPRIFTAGKGIGTTGGHADPTNGWRKDLMGDPGPAEGVVNSERRWKESSKAALQRWSRSY